ncbi:ABC transporter permease [Pseudoclavibacter chungangensis]|uniref:ABC transporter permease n=1 Tax=Pseudoclavibacter chungangensis TaxID=587635 RepID=A0A7J5BSD4_9MICO|nr:ABC transporter permease [Pseudoclavibacter chungangensis]KAB1655644.1 ABC transporter permease [Pseudoclavibacter chungangensis]NYJ67954.1 peptide/nickel transport system permease protein [Pseudoclavibacter chungangensis]
MTTIETAPAAAAAVRREPWFRRLPVVRELGQSVGIQRGMLVTGLVITLVFVLTALLAPVLAPYSFAQLRDGDVAFPAQAAPSPEHLLGTTVGGYDVLSRVIWGSQTALFVIVVAVALSMVIGVLLGLVSGYFGGWLDRVLVVVADAIYAFPSLLLAIVMSIVISGGRSDLVGGVLAAAFSITVVFIPQYFRVIRAEVVRVRQEAFVEAARVIGTPTHRILFRHVLRNATRTLPLILTLNASEAILTLAGLGFIGFGIEPTSAAEWGYDLNRSIADVSSGVWWTAVFPGLAIVLVVLGLTLLGESLNDLADPRLRTRRRPVAAKVATVEAAAAEPGSADLTLAEMEESVESDAEEAADASDPDPATASVPGEGDATTSTGSLADGDGTPNDAAPDDERPRPEGGAA